MTASETIATLPRLNEAEREEILRRILELDRSEEEIEFADKLLLSACASIDERERDDAGRFLQASAAQAFQAMDANEAEGGDRKEL